MFQATKALFFSLLILLNPGCKQRENNLNDTKSAATAELTEDLVLSNCAVARAGICTDNAQETWACSVTLDGAKASTPGRSNWCYTNYDLSVQLCDQGVNPEGFKIQCKKPMSTESTAFMLTGKFVSDLVWSDNAETVFENVAEFEASNRETYFIYMKDSEISFMQTGIKTTIPVRRLHADGDERKFKLATTSLSGHVANAIYWGGEDGDTAGFHYELTFNAVNGQRYGILYREKQRDLADRLRGHDAKLEVVPFSGNRVGLVSGSAQ